MSFFCNTNFRWNKLLVRQRSVCEFGHIHRPRDSTEITEFVVSWLAVKDLCTDHDERHASIHPHYLHINLHKAHWVSPPWLLQHMIVGDGGGRERCRHHQIHTHSTHQPPRRRTWQIPLTATSQPLLSASLICESNNSQLKNILTAVI